MENVKRFLSNKRPGWYVALVTLVLGLITLIVYTARGGNYLSPVSSAAVVLLVFAILTNLAVLVVDFKIAAIVPMILYASVVAVLLNTEMLFITNVIFGVDGNTLDAGFYTFVITAVLSMISSAVAFSMGLSKTNKIIPPVDTVSE